MKNFRGNFFVPANLLPTNRWPNPRVPTRFQLTAWQPLGLQQTGGQLLKWNLQQLPFAFSPSLIPFLMSRPWPFKLSSFVYCSTVKWSPTIGGVSGYGVQRAGSNPQNYRLTPNGGDAMRLHCSCQIQWKSKSQAILNSNGKSI